MKSPERTLEGLVLYAIPYQEDSAICALSTSEGVQALFAPHVYKPKSALKSLLIPGALVKVDGQKGNKGPFRARQSLTIYDTSSLVIQEKGNAFLFFLQDLSKTFFRYGDPFPLLDATRIIDQLSKGGDLLSLCLLLLGSVYRALGLPMEVHSCVHCGKKEVETYSLESGGLLCHDCALKSGVKSRPKMEVYVLKFAFLEPDEKNCRRIVPEDEGWKVLLELVHYLCSYFDLPTLASLALLRKACPNESN